MDSKIIRNVVIFKPTGADFCHNLAYKELSAEHLDGESFLTFEFKGSRIASFDSAQNPCLSVETEPYTGTTSLSLQDNKPIVAIKGKNSLSAFAFLRSSVPYSTIPITSGNAEGLKIQFQPTALSTRSKAVLHRYNIIDEQYGSYLGILLLPANGSEMTLAFEDGVTDKQKQLIIGVAAYIIADTFRVKYLVNATIVGFMVLLLVMFMIYLYFQ